MARCLKVLDLAGKQISGRFEAAIRRLAQVKLQAAHEARCAYLVELPPRLNLSRCSKQSTLHTSWQTIFTTASQTMHITQYLCPAHNA